jgi:transposase InsO family protein
MCRVLSVSVSGFYASLARAPSERRRSDERLTTEIRLLHGKNRHYRTYGSPRVHRELRASGIAAGEKRIARVMREGGIRAKQARAFRVTTNSSHSHPVAPNLLERQFSLERVPFRDRVWASDITYISTREGWLYLAAVLDLSSRRVVGWSMKHTLDRSLVLDALRMGLAGRRPPRDLLHHSDRGSQYACADYRTLLAEHGITCSMSRKGDCWDNAVAESFFATLKKELVHGSDWKTREEARADLFEYIEVWYNRERRHSSLGYVSPAEYEEMKFRKAA